jgi:hypothetical protein
VNRITIVHRLDYRISHNTSSQLEDESMAAVTPAATCSQRRVPDNDALRAKLKSLANDDSVTLSTTFQKPTGDTQLSLPAGETTWGHTRVPTGDTQFIGGSRDGSESSRETMIECPAVPLFHLFFSALFLDGMRWCWFRGPRPA